MLLKNDTRREVIQDLWLCPYLTGWLTI